MKQYKATAISPANIAFIKYWGWQNSDEQTQTIPANDSISMNLSNCLTKTTVAFSPELKKDSVRITFFEQHEKEVSGEPFKKVIDHVNRIRTIQNIEMPVKIVSHNSFPADAGIASSAAAFSALTLATSKALGLKLHKKELSILTRLSGSGSACRSVVDGFGYWQRDTNSDNCYAYQLHDEHWWDLADIVTVVSSKEKIVSSRDGHTLATTSPHYKTRLTELPVRIKKVKDAITNKDFTALGEAVEQEAISMHTICMTSQPPLFYWNSGTMEIIHALREWRKQGLSGYFTMDAGANVHIICQKKDVETLNQKLKNLDSVLFTIVNTPCKGTQLTKEHLF